MLARRVHATARGGPVPLDVHVKVDTGMGRWGMSAEDALRVGEDLRRPTGGCGWPGS